MKRWGYTKEYKGKADSNSGSGLHNVLCIVTPASWRPRIVKRTATPHRALPLAKKINKQIQLKTK